MNDSLILEKNLIAAKGFLNIFGFLLEETRNINEFSKVKIYNKQMRKVGLLNFENGKVLIKAKYHNDILVASYDIKKELKTPSLQNDEVLLKEWFCKINFQILNCKDININGDFLIKSTIIMAEKYEFNNFCSCSSTIKYYIPNKGDIIINMEKENFTFSVEKKFGDYNEKIKFRLWDGSNIFLVHDIIVGTFNKEKYAFPYAKHAGIYNLGGPLDLGYTLLHVCLKEKEYDTYLDKYDKCVKVDKSQLIVQQGLLMQKVDMELINSINELKDLFVIDNIPLLDNLISVCYENYSDEELTALFCLQRKNNFYQTGDKKFSDFYFNDSKINTLLLDKQKRL